MTLRTNGAEGHTSGTALTGGPGNSGDGPGDTAFDSVNKTGTAAVTFDSSHPAHGTNAYRVVTSSTSDICDTRWTSGISSTGVAARFYIYFNTLPTGIVTLYTIRNSGAVAAQVQFLSASNKLNIQNAAGTSLGAFAAAISAGVLYRVEIEAAPGGTTATGYVAGRYFLGDSTTPVDATTPNSTTNAGTTNITNTRWGKINSTSGTLDAWFDDIGFDDSGTTPLGPAVTSVDYVKSIDDPVGITDTGAPQTLDRGTTVADSVGATDSAVDVEAVAASKADPTGVTDTAAAVSAAARTQADPVGVTDTVGAVAAASAVAVDPVGVTDAASTVAAVIATPADPAAVTDTAATVVASVRGQDDPAGITDTATSQLDRAAPLNDPSGITDTASTVTAAAKSAADPVGATDSVSYTLTATPEQSITDNAGITDAVTVVVVSATSPADAVGITDATSTARGSSPADAAGITDGVTWTYTAARTAADAVGISDAATAVLSFGPVLANPVGVTDTVTVERGSVASTDDPAGVTDAAAVVVDAVSAVDDAAGIADEVSVVRVGIIEITVTDSVGMTDFANWHLSTGRNITVNARLVPQTSKYGATLEEQS